MDFKNVNENKFIKTQFEKRMKWILWKCLFDRNAANKRCFILLTQNCEWAHAKKKHLRSSSILNGVAKSALPMSWRECFKMWQNQILNR